MASGDDENLYGAVEAGGTKVNLAIGCSATNWLASARVETTTPERTIAGILEFFEGYRGRLRGFGVASFGPVRIDRAAPDWGKLLTTPKAGWSGASFVHPLIESFGLPAEIDTDVNCAVLAEHGLGSLRGVSSGVYLTVGTGIGGGFISGGSVIRGMMHPEVGHIRVLRTPDDRDSFSGSCPYHGDCLEGLASGPAIEKRWGCSLSDLPLDHSAREMIADYLGQACATLVLTLSTERIVIGGGVSRSPNLHATVARRMRHWLGGYLPDRRILGDGFIVSPDLEDLAGLTGAMLLAKRPPLKT